MLKITVVGLISAILTAGGVFATFDLLKDFIVIFMLLWYVLK